MTKVVNLDAINAHMGGMLSTLTERLLRLRIDKAEAEMADDFTAAAFIDLEMKVLGDTQRMLQDTKKFYNDMAEEVKCN